MRFPSELTKYRCIFSKFWTETNVDVRFLDMFPHVISHEDWRNNEKCENDLKMGPSVYDVNALPRSSRYSIKLSLPCVLSKATCCRVDGPEIESQWVLDFPHSSRPVLWSTQSPIRWVPDLFPGSKAAGAWCWPPTPSSAEVKARV